jgi:hypothetical protein
LIGVIVGSWSLFMLRVNLLDNRMFRSFLVFLPLFFHLPSWPLLTRNILTVTDLQGPPSERTPEQKLWDLKTRAQQYARDRESCDDVRISYLEFLETEAEDDLALARMIAG